MVIKLSEADHKAMDNYLEAVLNAYKNGEITLLQARSDLAHALTAAAIDNEDLKNYMRVDPKEKWLDKTSGLK